MKTNYVACCFSLEKHFALTSLQQQLPVDVIRNTKLLSCPITNLLITSALPLIPMQHNIMHKMEVRLIKSNDLGHSFSYLTFL